MGPTFRAIAYWTALLVSVLLVLAVSVAIVTTYVDVSTAVLAHGGRFLIAVAVFSAVFFGWRKDRGEAKKTKDLEAKLRDVEPKLRDLQSKLLHAIVRRPSNNDRPGPEPDTEKCETRPASLVPTGAHAEHA
jgi:hypothetical protein